MGGRLTPEPLQQLVRAEWWRAVATVTRLTGDLELAEEAVQDACVVALQQWPRDGVPANASSWLIGTARHNALDRMRRESGRARKEQLAALEARRAPVHHGDPGGFGDDQLALIFTCCHPALDPAVRVPLTLRAVCGLSTAEIAAVHLMPEPTMAQRLVRAKHKIRDAGIALRVPRRDERAERTADVLRVVYLTYTEGHRAARSPGLVRGDLCEEAIRLARGLVALMPGEPEVAGLLALLLLTDARRAARTDEAGRIVLLDDQDRGRWDAAKIVEGSALVEAALRQGHPGPYQLQAAIAACHAAAVSVDATDWPQIAALYDALLALEPSGVVAANRAVAVGMAHGPAAGLALADELAERPELRRWAPLHMARADLLRRLGRTGEAAEAYLEAARLDPPPAEHELIMRRLAAL